MRFGTVAGIALAAMLSGCAQLGYYAQAVHGQLAVQAEARPIAEVLADPASGEKLKARLARVQQIRAFAVDELSLPDNGSYKSYADLKRPFVLWNVVATPELSLVPKHWCFPIAGCVDYRGYYDKRDAVAFAEQLRGEGYDVRVGGVPAYSTLGWFDDPILSTFIGYADADLAGIVFHELAHQKVYAAGDTQFNESFATTVEQTGVERWLAEHGDQQQRVAYQLQQQRQHDFLGLLLRFRARLEENYARDVSDDDKRAQKAAIFGDLQQAYQQMKAGWGGYSGYDRWFAEPLSNAHLASVASYHDFVPAFSTLLQQEGSFPKFYQAVQELAALGKGERHRRLSLLAPAAGLPENAKQVDR